MFKFSITVVPESTKLIILKGISIINIWKTKKDVKCESKKFK